MITFYEILKAVFGYFTDKQLQDMSGTNFEKYKKLLRYIPYRQLCLLASALNSRAKRHAQTEIDNRKQRIAYSGLVLTGIVFLANYFTA